jgi:hypothetical protein
LPAPPLNRLEFLFQCRATACAGPPTSRPSPDQTLSSLPGCPLTSKAPVIAGGTSILRSTIFTEGTLLFSNDKSRWDPRLEIARVAMDGCAQWRARKDLLHEVQYTLSKAWLLTGIPERSELAKRDIPITGIRNGRSLANDVHAARVESNWRRFPLRNVARVWRHQLLRRQISRTNRKLPFKPNSGPVHYRRQPPLSNSSASFQVAPSAYSGWLSRNRLIGWVKRTKGLRRKLTTPGGANGSVASWRSLRSPALRSIVCLADLGRRQLHLLVCPSSVPYRRLFEAENRAPNSKSAVAQVRPPKEITGPWREDRKKLVGAPRFELGTPCTPC